MAHFNVFVLILDTSEEITAGLAVFTMTNKCRLTFTHLPVFYGQMSVRMQGRG